MKYRCDLSISRLREVLSYDSKTGVFVWLIPRGRWKAGMRAGTLHKKGYRYIWVDRIAYRSSRLAWLYVKGVWPSREIDHQNLDRGDDRFRNLRLATRGQNVCNCGVRKDNKLGVKGVSVRASNRFKKYVAQIQINRQKIGLGSYYTLEEAQAAYVAAARKHFGEFAGPV